MQYFNSKSESNYYKDQTQDQHYQIGNDFYTSNPLRFQYDIKNDEPIYTNYSYMKDIRVLEPDIGDVLLKMTVKIIFKSHDGYCSYFDDDTTGDYVHSETKTVAIYFKIPDEIKDRISELVEDGNLINNEDTEIYFREWIMHSNCNGSGACNFMDSYEPQKIEYVEIV